MEASRLLDVDAPADNSSNALASQLWAVNVPCFRSPCNRYLNSLSLCCTQAQTTSVLLMHMRTPSAGPHSTAQVARATVQMCQQEQWLQISYCCWPLHCWVLTSVVVGRFDRMAGHAPHAGRYLQHHILISDVDINDQWMPGSLSTAECAHTTTAAA